jgi:hypothetical protein
MRRKKVDYRCLRRVSFLSPEDGNRSSFRNVLIVCLYWSYLRKLQEKVPTNNRRKMIHKITLDKE